jgi:magnesium chelatase family protein
VSGPLRDRIDLWVNLPRVRPEDYVRGAAPEGTAEVARRVADSRRRQTTLRGSLNSRLTGHALRAACALGPSDQGHAIRLAEMDGWSVRGIERLLRVARTVADLAGSERVGAEHLDEAARFRLPSGRRAGFAAVV